MPLNSLDFTAGERHIQICLQKKNAFAATAQSRRGPREAVPATFNHQADKDGEGQGVTPRGLQDRELTGLGSCCADYGWGEDSRRCQADKMSASASGQGWVTTCGQVWGEWRKMSCRGQGSAFPMLATGQPQPARPEQEAP